MPRDWPTSFRGTIQQPRRSVIWLFRVTLTLPTIAVTPVYYFADRDKAVAATIRTTPATQDVGTFLFLALAMKRDQIRSSAQLAIDNMSIGVPNARVQFQSMQRRLGDLALDGVLDQAVVDIHLWDAQNPGQTCAWHSTWIVQNATVTRSTVSLDLEGRFASLKRQAPRTLHQPNCNNSVYDTSCGVPKANFTSSFAALAGSTTSTLLFLVTGNDILGHPKAAAAYYTLGQVVGTSGRNNGLYRAVLRHTLAGPNSALSLLAPFPYPPEPGDTFNLVKGCDNTLGVCLNGFNNIRGQPVGGVMRGGFRGFPDIPPIEKAFG